MVQRKKILFVLITFWMTTGLSQSVWACTDCWKSAFVYSRATTRSIATTLYNIYKWRHADTTFPTLNELNPVTFIPRGSSDDENTPKKEVLWLLKQTGFDSMIVINNRVYQVQGSIPEDIGNQQLPIFVYSGGYSNDRRPYAYNGYIAIKGGLMPGICLTFDFATDTRRGFNFCQQQDQHCVKTICNRIVEFSPQSSIILYGACKGAANNLRFLADQAEAIQPESCIQNIKAVISESPPISVPKALQYTPGAPVTLALMRMIFPNYNPQAKTIMQTAQFPKIPVLIASLPKDTISELGDMFAMNSHLNKACQANVEQFVSEEADLRHGKIGKAKDYRSAVAAFLKEHVAANINSAIELS